VTSYYDVLQLPPEPSDEAIKRSARWARQAVAHDPDRQRRLAAIDEAYETLRNPTRRRTYDAELAAGTAPSVAGNGVPLVAADAPLPTADRGCWVCGASPARNFRVVRLTGPLHWRQLNEDRRSYCNEHGCCEVANANRFNLTVGWLGVPVNLLFTFVNLYSWRRYRSLGSPSHGVAATQRR
jgi:curved DNA-binding protein CbpA